MCTHPKALQLAQINKGSLVINANDSFVDDRSTLVSEDGDVACLDNTEEDEGDGAETDGKANGSRVEVEADREDQPPPEDELSVTASLSSLWWSQFVTEEVLADIEHGGKFVLFRDILRHWNQIGQKMVVFAQSLLTLDLIEELLAKEDAKNEENRATLAATKKVDGALKYFHLVWRLNCCFFSSTAWREEQSEQYLEKEQGLLPSGRPNVDRSSPEVVRLVQ